MVKEIKEAAQYMLNNERLWDFNHNMCWTCCALLEVHKHISNEPDTSSFADMRNELSKKYNYEVLEPKLKEMGLPQYLNIMFFITDYYDVVRKVCPDVTLRQLRIDWLTWLTQLEE